MSALTSPWRRDFPFFKQSEYVYLDSAATSQKPQVMLDALLAYYQEGAANVHRAQHHLGDKATTAFESARRLAAQWLNAQAAQNIIFTRGTTESINLLAYGLERLFRVGDEILISAAEHHANLLPWQQLAKRTGAKLVVLPLTACGDVDQTQALELIRASTKLVALTQLSNVLGREQNLAPLIAQAQRFGALTVVDGAQACVHQRPDMQRLDSDFYVCSAHKVYGPEGVGLLYGKPHALSLLAPWQFGGEMVETAQFSDASFREAPLGFEAGTPAIGAVIAFAASLNYLLGLDPNAVQAYEAKLFQALLAGLKARPAVKLLGEPTSALICFSVNAVHHSDLAQLLAEQNICVRAGQHCAMPLMQTLGVKGATRVSLALYNDHTDLERFFNALDKALELLA